MKKIKVSNHALIRRHQRFCPESNLDKDQLESEIITDFLDSKKQSNTTYVSKHSLYIVFEENNVINIVTTWGINEDSLEPKKKTIFSGDIIIRSKTDNKNINYVLKSVLENDDQIILCHMGHKKLMLINDFVVLSNIDFEKGKTIYTILKIWDSEFFYDLKELESFKNEYFAMKLSDWDNFLKHLNLINYIHKKEIDFVSPEIQTYKQVLNGTLPKFPSRFWQDDKGGKIYIAAQECVKYLIEDILKWKTSDILKNWTADVLRKYKLSGMLDILFEDNPFNALDNAYPDKFKPYYFKKSTFEIRWYWNPEKDGLQHAKEAIQWLVLELNKDGYKINNNALLSYNWERLLKNYGVSGILSITFKNDYFSFFKELFEKEFSDSEIFNYTETIINSSKVMSKVHF